MAPRRHIRVGTTTDQRWASLATVASEPTPIVQRAGWSGRTKLLVAFMAFDALAVAVVLIVLTR